MYTQSAHCREFVAFLLAPSLTTTTTTSSSSSVSSSSAATATTTTNDPQGQSMPTVWVDRAAIRGIITQPLEPRSRRAPPLPAKVATWPSTQTPTRSLRSALKAGVAGAEGEKPKKNVMITLEDETVVSPGFSENDVWVLPPYQIEC